jgi:hydroxymethylpyrimidine/phosphomethylpyrimidine kinase
MAIKAPPNLICISGLDPLGASGIAADIRTISSLNAFCAPIVSCITVQNSKGFYANLNVEPDIIARQIEAIKDELDIRVVKTGMLANPEIIYMLCHVLKDIEYLIVDPVLKATSDSSNVSDELVKAYHKLFEIAYLVTPNVFEAEKLFDYSIDLLLNSKVEFKSKYLLLTGIKRGEQIYDILLGNEIIREFANPFLSTQNDRGTGCILSSAIATFLSRGLDLNTAVENAESYLHENLSASQPLKLAKDRGYVLWKTKSA